MPESTVAAKRIINSRHAIIHSWSQLGVSQTELMTAITTDIEVNP